MSVEIFDRDSEEELFEEPILLESNSTKEKQKSEIDLFDKKKYLLDLIIDYDFNLFFKNFVEPKMDEFANFDTNEDEIEAILSLVDEKEIYTQLLNFLLIVVLDRMFSEDTATVQVQQTKFLNMLDEAYANLQNESSFHGLYSALKLKLPQKYGDQNKFFPEGFKEFFDSAKKCTGNGGIMGKANAVRRTIVNDFHRYWKPRGIESGKTIKDYLAETKYHYMFFDTFKNRKENIRRSFLNLSSKTVNILKNYDTRESLKKYLEDLFQQSYFKRIQQEIIGKKDKWFPPEWLAFVMLSEPSEKPLKIFSTITNSELKAKQKVNIEEENGKSAIDDIKELSKRNKRKYSTINENQEKEKEVKIVVQFPENSLDSLIENYQNRIKLLTELKEDENKIKTLRKELIQLLEQQAEVLKNNTKAQTNGNKRNVTTSSSSQSTPINGYSLTQFLPNNEVNEDDIDFFKFI